MAQIINFLERTDFVLFQTLLLSNVNGDDRKNQQEALFYNNVYSPFNSAREVMAPDLLIELFRLDSSFVCHVYHPWESRN